MHFLLFINSRLNNTTQPIKILFFLLLLKFHAILYTLSPSNSLFLLIFYVGFCLFVCLTVYFYGVLEFLIDFKNSTIYVCHFCIVRSYIILYSSSNLFILYACIRICLYVCMNRTYSHILYSQQYAIDEMYTLHSSKGHLGLIHKKKLSFN